MFFSENSLSISLTLCLIPFIVAIILQFKFLKDKLSLWLLCIGSFLLRLLMTSLDPFLYDWDERFHALVAKNMMDNPFKPMLRVMPILPYNVEAWCCNHIWLHKQPFFMWQMALSMKIFGVNEIAMRLPSAICGAIAVFFIYEIALAWTKNSTISFIAAFFYALNNKFLELVAGRAQLEHNDMIFAFYVTASIWAYTKYVYQKTFKWAIIIGVFCGIAILTKWLTALLVFAGWGISLLYSKKERLRFDNYLHLITSLIATCVVFVPWQIFIIYQYPAEAAASYASNIKHITENLSDPKSIWYHFTHIQTVYRFAILIPIGIFFAIRNKNLSNRFSVSFLTMAAVIFSFFSFFVATKMPAFTYPIMSIFFILMAIGLFSIFEKLHFLRQWKQTFFIFTILAIGLIQFSPWKMINDRKNSEFVKSQIEDTKQIKLINDTELKDYVIFNAKSFQDVEIMFYKNLNVYQWYPEEEEIKKLIEKGYKIAMLDYSTQHPPEYIKHFSMIKVVKMD